ncbi:serine/threonine-protein kinase [Burkholderia sp. Bp8998]|uniref:serine/threonine-protein kinase n=1 Tax=Burkholderia sp. Bp8998 TaxID=2184557 RepID=UPI000F5AFBBE|nr:serine/threonine-protein kinase [Burkholderia sp. Bp8998]RQS23406.1 serine/threonine protein kinase [Burkholderia sp. Bp8998]
MKDPSSRDNDHDTATRGDAPEFTVRPLPLGHRLGELQLDEVLGIGGFGIVYRAFDRTLRRAVAIKEYMPSMLATRGGDYTVSLRSERFAQAFDAGRGAFLNEARLLAQFDHPGLVKVLHFWESHGTAYMVMPFYEGRTLKQLLDGGMRMSETQLRNIVGALLGALDTLHRAQCFHRDVALDNVLIRPNGSAILLDFGAARKRIGDLVDDGAMMIKPGYAPIEQYTDDPAFSQGPWTDLYALGAVMHAMITGELPPAAVVRSIKDTYRPLASRELPAGEVYSPAFLAAIDHALQLRIPDRPESVVAFAAELGLRDVDRAGGGYGAVVAPPAVDAGGGGERKVASGVSDASGASGVADKASAAAVDERSASQPEAHDDASMRSASAGADVGQRGATATGNLNGTAEPIAGAGAGATTSTSTSSWGTSPSSRTPRRPSFIAAGNRRMPIYVGGALAALIVVGIAATYLSRPAQVASEPEAAASQPQAGAASSASESEATLAQRGPTPIVVPPSSLPAGSSAQVPPPSLAAAPASAPAVGAVGAAASAPQVATTATDVAGPTPSPAGSRSTIAPAGSLDASERVVNVPPSEATASPSTAPVPAQTSPSEADTAVAAVSAPATEPRPPKQETVQVRFNVRPWGDVYVNGARRGASPPLRSVSLTPGVYQIEIRNGSLPPLHRTVAIDFGSKPVNIDYAFE